MDALVRGAWPIPIEAIQQAAEWRLEGYDVGFRLDARAGVIQLVQRSPHGRWRNPHGHEDDAGEEFGRVIHG